MSLSQSFLVQLSNKCTIVHERLGYPSNQPHTDAFPLQVHRMAISAIKHCSELIDQFLGELCITPKHHMESTVVNGLK